MILWIITSTERLTERENGSMEVILLKVLLWILILLCVVAVFGAVFIVAGGVELFHECVKDIPRPDRPICPTMRYYV